MAICYYVYVYRDPRTAAPIYVGKGSGTRAFFHQRSRRTNRGLQEILRNLRASGLKPFVEIVKEFDVEREAFAFEKCLIECFGRRDLGTGSLVNLSDGGEGPTGVRHNEHALRKISDASKKMHSDPHLSARRAAKISESLQRPEAKVRRSEIMKEVHSRPGDKERRAASQRATFSTEISRAKRIRSRILILSNPSNKAKHSEGLKRRWASQEERVGQSERMKRLYDDPDFRRRQREGARSWRAVRAEK